MQAFARPPPIIARSLEGSMSPPARSEHSMRSPNPLVGRLAATILAACTLFLVLSSSALATTSDTRDEATLHQLATRLGLHVGSTVSYTALSTDAQYAQILGQQFSAITPENEMKWVSVEPQQGVYNFDQADAEVQFAEQHNRLVRGH